MRRNPCKIASAGLVDSYPCLFQELISDLFEKERQFPRLVSGVNLQSSHVDSCHVLFQVLIYNQLFTDSCPVLFQVLIWNPLYVGRRDSCPGLFQELISDLFKKERQFPRLVSGVNLKSVHVDSCPVLLQVLIYNQLFTDSCPVLFQVLIWNLLKIDDDIRLFVNFT